MNEEIKVLAQKTVDKIYRKIKRARIKDFHKFGVNIGVGADGTPTKYIDKIAEDVAINFIKKSNLSVNILTEEAGFLDFSGKYTFVLDPIDGTSNAVRDIPFYSISLGIGESCLDDISYGIVKNIPTGDVYIAEKNYGAFFNNQRIRTPDFPGKEKLYSLNLRKNFDRNKIFLFNNGKLRSLGSASLEICMVATGSLDYYFIDNEFLRVTDIAAAILVLKEAGGVVTNILGNKIDMSLNLDDRTSIIAACNENVIRKIIS